MAAAQCLISHRKRAYFPSQNTSRAFIQDALPLFCGKKSVLSDGVYYVRIDAHGNQ